MNNIEITQKLTDFTNNAMCRRLCNQVKANSIFNTIRPYISTMESIDIIDSWTEYKNGDINQEEFGNVLKEIKLTYIN